MEEFQSERMSSQYPTGSYVPNHPQSRSVLEDNPVLKDVLSDPFSDNTPRFQELDSRRSSIKSQSSTASSSVPVWDGFKGAPETPPNLLFMPDKCDSPGGFPWPSQQKNGSPSNGYLSPASPYNNSYDPKDVKNVEWNKYSSPNTNTNPNPDPNQNSTPYPVQQNKNGQQLSPWNSINNTDNHMANLEYVTQSNTTEPNWDYKSRTSDLSWVQNSRQGQSIPPNWQSQADPQWGRSDQNTQGWNMSEHPVVQSTWNRGDTNNHNWSNPDINPQAHQWNRGGDQRAPQWNQSELSNQHWNRSEQGSPALPPWEEFNPQTGKRKRISKSSMMTDFEALAGAMEDSSNSSNESLPYACSVCGKSFKFKAFLKLHFQKHTDEKPYSCEFCGKCYSYKSSLQTHRLLHLEPGASYTCDICGIEFNKKQYLAKHKMKDHAQDNNDKQFSCGSCHKRFLSAFDLKHHSNCQVKEKPYQCSICHKFFSAKNSLKVHEKLHIEKMQMDARAFPCEMCGEAFPKEDMLNNHRRQHMEGKSYRCDMCSTTFGFRGQLQRHILMCRKVPDDSIQKFKCELCNQNFRADWQLQQHMETHSIDNPGDRCSRLSMTGHNVGMNMSTPSDGGNMAGQSVGDASGMAMNNSGFTNINENCTPMPPIGCHIEGSIPDMADSCNTMNNHMGMRPIDPNLGEGAYNMHQELNVQNNYYQ